MSFVCYIMQPKIHMDGKERDNYRAPRTFQGPAGAASAWKDGTVCLVERVPEISSHTGLPHDDAKKESRGKSQTEPWEFQLLSSLYPMTPGTARNFCRQPMLSESCSATARS